MRPPSNARSASAAAGDALERPHVVRRAPRARARDRAATPHRARSRGGLPRAGPRTSPPHAPSASIAVTSTSRTSTPCRSSSDRARLPSATVECPTSSHSLRRPIANSGLRSTSTISCSSPRSSRSSTAAARPGEAAAEDQRARAHASLPARATTVELGRRELVDELLHAAHPLLELRVALPAPNGLHVVPPEEAHVAALVAHVAREDRRLGRSRERRRPPCELLARRRGRRPPGPGKGRQEPVV